MILRIPKLEVVCYTTNERILATQVEGELSQRPPPEAVA